MIRDFHPEAAKAISDRASQLATELRPPERDERPGFAGPLPHVAATLGSTDILSLGPVSHSDIAGQETARFALVDAKWLGLSGEAYRRFALLAEKIQSTATLADAISLHTVKELLFDWLITTRSGGKTALPDHLVAIARERIKAHRLVIPIYDLALEADHRVGRVVLHPVSGTEIDQWLEQLTTHHPQLAAQLGPVETRFRKRFQGRAASTVEIEAEARRAKERAYADTEQALAALRLFSPGTLHPRAQTICVPFGFQHRASEYFVAFEGGRLLGAQERMLTAGPPAWQLNEGAFTTAWSAGLSILSELLAADAPSPIGTDVLRSLVVYSRVCLTRDLAEKLLHVFMALEGLLLRNPNEPIQSSLSERIAFLTGSTADERMKIAANVKDAYALRSKIVHHAARVEEADVVGQMLFKGFDAFFAIVRNHARFANRDALISALERRKFA